jgi:hypothetical protein
MTHHRPVRHRPFLGSRGAGGYTRDRVTMAAQRAVKNKGEGFRCFVAALS